MRERGKDSSYFSILPLSASVWNVSIKQRGKIEQKREWEKIWPKWVGKSLSTALSGVTCREVGWIWRENGWLEGRYAARGVGEVVLAWYETETQSMKSLSLHWLAWLPHCCWAFIYGSKNDSLDGPETVSQPLYDLPHWKPCSRGALPFLPPRFLSFNDIFRPQQELKGFVCLLGGRIGGNELRWEGEDGPPFAPNFWQPELLLFAIYSRFCLTTANQREFVRADKVWHEVSNWANQSILRAAHLGLFMHSCRCVSVCPCVNL